MMMFGISLLIMLLLGFPFMVTLLGSLILYIAVYMPEFAPKMLVTMVQQVIAGVTPPALVCVPMFILSASIITSGESATRLIRMIKVFVGHLPGGLPITTNASCTLFGAVSGSTQATVAAIGGTMRPMLLEAGYKSSFTLGLIINSSDIAFLIPPSIGFIVYGVATSTSIGMLFLAGILPGLMILVMFSIYCYVYSKVTHVGTLPRASMAERIDAVKGGLPVMGFPVIIVGGIYTGILSPTEAAAAAVFYALILEIIVFRSLTRERIIDAFLQTGVITGVVFILVGAGQAFSFLIGFLQLPDQLLPPLFGTDPSMLRVITIVVVVYFVACMFVDPIVAIFILSPVFQPYVVGAGVDPILLGTLVTLQAAIGSATPPFGCDIFTAQLIFRRPYLEVIGHALPFLLILILATVLLITFPQIALFLPNLAMGG
ncbi:TRAP transporter large permease [Desulfotignum phosphitoxidans]|jgi:tripartite ATP-independent transporter DctM subunit|uniref:TRAP-type C4-dicarboxylate permease, large subunit DctM n=1 Tax=Desulfotignum phosphitoxidans DSM 13687 TaxID=1286635 RepID=S0G5H7_9BACT|nr:TRAP transporter large permease [Desulfotignum phosphitoxidans]EMS79466.1 TRAP-type C4-dicarboxylate permease, large subunit DctM [Desulfotignum phosphitoxidans DSM 13687]